MTKCVNWVAIAGWYHRSAFQKSGLRPKLIDLGDGTTMNCWVPKTPTDRKANLVLVHGLGAKATWQFSGIVPAFTPFFNVYVPDLVFFGKSFTTRPERTESFQAQCVMRLMESLSVSKMSVVGLSYGGFVAYSMAAQFKEAVEKLVICCAGVSLEEKDLEAGLFPVKDLEEASDILLPQTAGKLKEMLRFTFVKPPKRLPSFLIDDFIYVMCMENVEEKKDLVRAIPKDRRLPNLPKTPQPTLIIWGDRDQIFPLELGHRLKRHLGDNAELVVIKNTGHAFVYEKPKQFLKHLKSFLIPPPPSSSSTTTTSTTTTTTTTSTSTTNSSSSSSSLKLKPAVTNGSV